MKIILFVLLLTSIVFSKTYEFTETRYSNALDKERKLYGVIDFLDKGVRIKYNDTDIELLYKDGDFEYLKGGEKLTLQEGQKSYLTNFFNIIYLIHKNNFQKLSNNFSVVRKENMIILYPTDVSKEYVEKLKIAQTNKQVDQITLYLKNGDYIDIGIGNEIY